MSDAYYQSAAKRKAVPEDKGEEGSSSFAANNTSIQSPAP